MDKEKEIEKIKTIMGCDYNDCESCYSYSKKSCSLRPMAERLVDAGYGDVQAAVKEFAERIINAFFCEFADDMTFKKASRIEKIIKEACGDEVSKNDEA